MGIIIIIIIGFSIYYQIIQGFTRIPRGMNQRLTDGC